MFAAFAVMAISTYLPAQPAQLAVSNVRFTYGPLGATRPEGKLLPGDNLFVGFDIEGITVDDAGKVRYSTALELTDNNGKVVFKQLPKDEETINSLGGTSLPAFAEVEIGLEQPAGQCSLKVTVTDLATKKSDTFTKKFEVAPRGFGIVRVAITSDPDGKDPIAVLGTGQTLWINAAVVGFALDKASNQPNLSFELSIVDDNGKPTLKKPFTGTVNKDVPDKTPAVPVQFFVPLNRAGKFTATLKVTDTVSGASATQKLPISVLPSGK
jgi:hypothetical protein